MYYNDKKDADNNQEYIHNLKKLLSHLNAILVKDQWFLFML